MKRVKLFLLATTLGFVLALTLSCDSSGNPSALVDHWVHLSGRTHGKPEDMELFKDGTGICDGKLSITWKVENKRFIIQSPLAGLASDYKVSGSKLTLIYDNGDSTVFAKKADYEKLVKQEAEKAEAKDPAAEIVPAAGTWTKMQQAYIAETNRVDDCKKIGYTLPGNGKTKNFTYSCKIENGIAYWIAENHNNLGKCPVGNQWILSMRNGDYQPEVYLPENKDCQELTPNFEKLGKKGNAKNKEGATAAETQAKASAERDSFIDPRDNQTYKTIKIGNQTWTENFNYNVNGSKCYNNDPANCQKYGRLYNWSAAISACPSGWHLPTNAEWDALYRFADGTSGTSSPYKSETAGKYLKAKSGWNDSGNGTDDYGFAALPGGLGNSAGKFFSIGNYGNWWSSSEHDGDHAYSHFKSHKHNNAGWESEVKSKLFSVRCVQD